MNVTLANTKYFNGPMTLSFASYGDGSTAITITDERGAPMGRATVCIVEHGFTPPEGSIVVKNYEENEGMLDALIAAGVIEPPSEVQKFQSGWGEMTEFPICKLTPAALEAREMFR